MSYSVSDVLDKADKLYVSVSFNQPNLKRPAVFRFHGKNKRIVDCVGTDNAVAFLAAIEVAHGFKFQSKEFKSMNKTTGFDPMRKPMVRIESNGGVW